jgi:hypothetical protein
VRRRNDHQLPRFVDNHQLNTSPDGGQMTRLFVSNAISAA